MVLWRDLRFMRLILLSMFGRKFWVLPMLPLIWLGFIALAVGLDPNEMIRAEEVLGTLLGIPMTVLGIYFGMRIIAGEIEDRSLEVAYTVPGGSHRLWLLKLWGGFLLLLTAEIILATVVASLITFFPFSAIYGAMQASFFYMALSMAMSTLFRNEIAGAVFTISILAFNGLITDFGENQLPISPFWNPEMVTGADVTEVFAWSVQNRVGMILVICGMISLAFMRANRRERMLTDS